MILYLDTSAMVKRYLVELGSAEVKAAIESSDIVGSSIISRAELAAALAKAVRMNALDRAAARGALQLFHIDWSDVVRIQANEWVMAQAETLAWDLGLRGYDSVHLASALAWQEGIDKPVTFATFDKRLWEAATASGLSAFPPDISGLMLSGSSVPA